MISPRCLSLRLFIWERPGLLRGDKHMNKKKKKATKSGAHHSGKCCFYRSMSIRAQTQLMCSISTTEPSSEGNVSRLEVGQMEVSCPQGGSAAATFWHLRCFWTTHPSLFHLEKALFLSACPSPESTTDPSHTHLWHPRVLLYLHTAPCPSRISCLRSCCLEAE